MASGIGERREVLADMAFNPLEHMREVVGNGVDRLSRLSSERLGFNPSEVQDVYSTPYEHRQTHLPKTHASFDGEPGESIARPNPDTETGRKALETLKKYNQEGIKYKDCYPVFDSVAEDSVEIDMTDDIVSNYSKADAALADKWKTEQRDNRDDWTARKVAEYRTANKLSWHESQDLKTCQLIPRSIHECFLHDGGRCEYMFRHQIPLFKGAL